MSAYAPVLKCAVTSRATIVPSERTPVFIRTRTACFVIVTNSSSRVRTSRTRRRGETEDLGQLRAQHVGDLRARVNRDRAAAHVRDARVCLERHVLDGRRR